MTEHVWVNVPFRRGPRKGQPGPQRRCENCALWETELSRGLPCEPAEGAPFDFGECRS